MGTVPTDLTHLTWDVTMPKMDETMIQNDKRFSTCEYVARYLPLGEKHRAETAP